jgi:hypothetical protein
MSFDRDYPPPRFWARLSAAALIAAAALLLLAIPVTPDLGVPESMGRPLALLLLPSVVFIAFGCWAQRGVEFGPSAPSPGDLERLLAAKRNNYPARPMPPRVSAPPRPVPAGRPRTRPPILAELVEEGDEVSVPPDVIDRLLWAKRRGYRRHRQG